MSSFSHLFSTGPEYASIRYDLEKGRYPFGVLGLPPATKHLLIHTLCENTKHGALVVTPDEAAAMKCVDDLAVYGTKAV